MPPAPPTDPYVKYSLIRFVSTGLSASDPGRFPVQAHDTLLPSTQSKQVPLTQVDELIVSPVFPSPRGHARLRLPAASRPLSRVPWASVPLASGPVTLRPLNLRYYALLRLPSSIPAGSLLAPDRYLGLTRCASWSARLAPRSARSPSASNGKRLGVVCAGHPHSGVGSQGDGRFSRVPGFPL